VPRTKSIPGITIVTNEERLRLRVPGSLLPENKQQFVALGLDDTPANRLTAEAKILEIRSDMLNGEFDTTLDKYRLKGKARAAKIADIGKLWIEYLKYKQKSAKESHYDHLARGLGKLIAANPYQEIDDALAFREWLLENTTIGMTKRILTHCNAAVEWGMKNRLVVGSSSPYSGMSGDLPKHAWELEGKPNALTLDEIGKVRAAFADHDDINVENYAMFVDFLFLTGCRPSEAIGLRVCDVAKGSHITFNGAIVRVQGRAVRTTGSKNNKARKFPINRDLEKLLDEAIWDTFKPEDLVFTSISGKTILYSYFCGKIWKSIVTPIIGRDSTPYSCRDSFITHQLAGSMPPSNVCAWCDTSIPVIQKRYLDPALAFEVRPLNLGDKNL
jgi:integrase